MRSRFPSPAPLGLAAGAVAIRPAAADRAPGAAENGRGGGIRDAGARTPDPTAGAPRSAERGAHHVA